MRTCLKSLLLGSLAFGCVCSGEFNRDCHAQVLKIKKPKLPNPHPPDPVKDAKDKLEKIKNLNPAGASEEMWGEAGRIAYTGGARIMSKRSPTGEPLDRKTKDILRGQYGDLVNKVTVHWGTPTLDEWAAERFKIRMTSVESEAQTYGYDIYVKWRKGQQSDSDRLSLLAHEMMHAHQYERFGKSLSDFGYHYFKEYKKANEKYASNKLEREAVAAEHASPSVARK